MMENRGDIGFVLKEVFNLGFGIQKYFIGLKAFTGEMPKLKGFVIAKNYLMKVSAE